MTYGNGYGQRRTAIPIRLIISVGIALFAIVGYYMKSEINPVTGEKQRVGMGTEQEMALGLQAAPQMMQEMGGEVDPRDPDAQRVMQIGNRLAYETEAAKSPYAQEKNFHFHLLRDPKTINAFALPGGQIFITKALYDKLENEAQLAGVLGHEVGHVIHRHGAEHMATGQLGGLLATAVGVAASDERGRGNMAAVAAQMANQMVQLKYGRSDELESDAYGIRLMLNLGYDPAEMLGVMRILAEASKGGHQPEMLLTHPYPENRIAQINQILEQDKADIASKQLTKGAPLH
jgi:beta-barrel assembly-enhancing protease